MRILFAVHTYYPAKNGVQAVTQYMAEGLARHHKVLVITERKEGNGLESCEEHGGVRIERIRVDQRGYRFVGDRSLFLQRIREWMPEVLISVCTQTWPFDWLWGELDAIPCRKVLYTHGYSGLMEHWPLWDDLRHLRLRAFQYHAHWKWYYHRAWRYIAQYDLVTYLSEESPSVRYASEHGLTNGAVLCNAVEDVFFEDSVPERLKKERGSDAENQPLRFIYVANYDWRKNQCMVLRAFAKAALKETELIFIGSSPNEYYQDVLTQARALQDAGLLQIHTSEPEVRTGPMGENGHEDGTVISPDSGSGSGNPAQVMILTGIDRAEIPIQLGRADVFVCGSRMEQYPIMLCEAAAKGLPIISTEVGHAAQMDGCLIVHSVDEMAEAMRHLAESPGERMERGCRLRNYALAQYRIQDKLDWMEARLQQLVRTG